MRFGQTISPTIGTECNRLIHHRVTSILLVTGVGEDFERLNVKSFIGVLIAVLGLLGGCGEAEQQSAKIGDQAESRQAKPGTLAASESQIAGVDVFEETKHASVKVDLVHGWAESSLPMQVALVLESTGKAIKSGQSEIPKSNETINFWFTAPFEDGTRGKVMEFRVKTSDLRGADYESEPPQSLLEYAIKPEVKYAARAGVDEYCRSNSASNPVFCAG